MKNVLAFEYKLNTRADADNLKMGKYWFIGKTDH